MDVGGVHIGGNGIESRDICYQKNFACLIVFSGGVAVKTWICYTNPMC